MNIIKVQYGADIPDNFTGIVEYEDGDKKEWYKEGKYHREDGPAFFIIFINSFLISFTFFLNLFVFYLTYKK